MLFYNLLGGLITRPNRDLYGYVNCTRACTSALGDIIEVIIEALRYFTQIVHSNSKMLFL